MNNIRSGTIYAVLVVILVLSTAGCVAPPQENTTFNPLAGQNKTTLETPTPLSYVSEVTLSEYAQTTPTTSGYTTFGTTTPIPADITCRIYRLDLFGYNGTAFLFNLKNPPMYIQYSVVPTNVTVNRVYTDPFSKETKTLTRSEYSPNSWFEVTVFDNATNELLLKDGFGEGRGLSVYTNRTLKVLKTGDIRAEFRGSEIQSASAIIWVKPIGNFPDSRLSEFTDCTYLEANRESLVLATPTTISGGIYTWTPENQVTG